MNAKSFKFFVHDSVINPAGQRGVDRCYHMFTSALAEEFPEQVLVYSNRKDEFFGSKIIHPLSLHYGKFFPRKVNSVVDNLEGKAIADRLAKVYYSPFYGRINTRISQVYTAHDMIFERFPGYFSSLTQKRFIDQKRKCFERADLVLCVSNSTVNDILEYYPTLSKDKIKCVYIGVEDIFFNEQSDSDQSNSSIEKPYFLYVGNRKFYKNFSRFLIAFGESKLSTDFQLKVISPLSDFPTAEEIEIIEKYHLEDDIQVEISIPDSVLSERYQNAFAFIFPSEYEGFGLPLIEAMASGTLVLSSNTSSLPEIGENIPLYFDPSSIDSIKNSLLEACSLPDSVRQDRIKKGRTRAKIFTWESSKKMFLSEVESLL